MSSGYFSNVRHDIVPYVPARSARVLEIGCGTGNTLAYLKHERLAAWVGGFEYDAASADEARTKVDWLQHGDVERDTIELEPGSLDAILCLDVLEHLRDPWALMPKLTKLLTPNGVVISSIPNVRNRHVVRDLVFKNKWEYADEGLLDRTHLRFFTRPSARHLMECGGLKIDVETDLGFSDRPERKFKNAMAFGMLKDFYVHQFIFRARRAG
ncbi:MAG: class I SAM-dependent methyltransferase [Terricaulis sp.]